MKKSPCPSCGAEVLHTDEEQHVLCEDCDRIQMTVEILEDMVHGRLPVPVPDYEAMAEKIREQQEEDDAA